MTFRSISVLCISLAICGDVVSIRCERPFRKLVQLQRSIIRRRELNFNFRKWIHSIFIRSRMWLVVSVAILWLLIPKLSFLLKNEAHKWNRAKKLNWFQSLFFLGISSFARDWNGYEVHGIDKFTPNELTHNCLLVGYHSRGTLDLIYLFNYLQPSILISHLFFNIPGFSAMLTQFGLISSNSHKHDKAEQRMLSALGSGGKPVMLMPGGAHECLKPHNQIGSVHWKTEPGFVRLIAKHYRETGEVIRVIPFYTKNCERMYFNSAWWYDLTSDFTRSVYDRFKNGNIMLMPMLLTCVLCSVGFFLLPSRVKVDTYFGDAILFNDLKRTRDNSAAESTVVAEKESQDTTSTEAFDAHGSSGDLCAGSAVAVVSAEPGSPLSTAGDSDTEHDQKPVDFVKTRHSSEDTLEATAILTQRSVKKSTFLAEVETEVEFAARVVREMDLLIAHVESLPEREHVKCNPVYLFALGVYALAQNTVISTVTMTAVWCTYPFLIVFCVWKFLTKLLC